MQLRRPLSFTLAGIPLGPREISRSSGMYNPIHPSSWQCTYTIPPSFWWSTNTVIWKSISKYFVKVFLGVTFFYSQGTLIGQGWHMASQYFCRPNLEKKISWKNIGSLECDRTDQIWNEIILLETFLVFFLNVINYLCSYKTLNKSLISQLKECKYAFSHVQIFQNNGPI